MADKMPAEVLAKFEKDREEKKAPSGDEVKMENISEPRKKLVLTKKRSNFLDGSLYRSPQQV